MEGLTTLILVAVGMFGLLTAIPLISHMYNLNHIKSKTVGDGQHGTARWATKGEIRKTYRHVPFTPEQWRKEAAEGKTPTIAGTGKPLPQGIVVGCTGRRNTTALVDTGDVHALMIGAAGVGKTAYWLYPCIEYACASGMSFLSTDTKDNVTWPGINTIARDLSLSRSTVKRAIWDLEQADLVRKEARCRTNGSATSNLYTLTTEA